MNYIYIYTNLVNNHQYVGQTNNLQRRIREHKSCAFNKKANSYNDLIHRKIREYGIENFEVEVLETLYNASQEEVDEREKYWIEKKKTHCSFSGYNMTYGGREQISRNRKISDEEIKEIKQLLKEKDCCFYDIERQYHICPSYISSINHGYVAFDEKETYPLHSFYKTNEDYDDLIELLVNSNLPMAEIARQLNIGYSTVKKINSGRLRKGLYPTYPIRKTNRADRIKDYLLNSNYSIKEIMEKVGCSDETVRRINRGETFKDDNLSYPLRNL